MSWSEAEAQAVAWGGHLVTIDDLAENAWLLDTYEYLWTDSGKNGLWIGLTDAAQEGTWTWISGSTSSLLNWAPTEPNGGVEDCDCGMMWLDDGQCQWNDTYDSDARHGIVQIP